MEVQITTVVSGLVGAAFGMLICWLIMRNRLSIAVAATTTAGAHAGAQVEMALVAANERLRSLEQENSTAIKALAALHEETKLLRNDLDASRDERAQLKERAVRVPQLDAQVAEFLEKQEITQEEIRRLSASEADKAQALIATELRATTAEEARARMEQDLSTTLKSLNGANERKATLEAEAEQLPVLVDKLAEAERALVEANIQIANLREQSGALTATLTAEQETLAIFRSDFANEKIGHEQAKAQIGTLTTELAELRAKFENEKLSAREKLSLLTEAKQALTDQFRNLANEILEEKARRFTEQNQTNLGELLNPLKLKIAEFQTKVEDVYVQEGKERTLLADQVRRLMELNQLLSEDAKNLTRALKGSSKAQGSWGELVLERVLEASGLRKDEEYVVQVSHTREDGTRALPDVVIRLPEDRNLVVDAKVSLTAYEEFASTEDEADRVTAGKRHLDSIRAHIKGLSEKNYQSLYDLKTLDFVLMFVPVEPAFMVAVTSDRDLFMDAWKRNVLLVSPSTLLFVVRTVAHLWRQEAQSRNAQDIAKRGADLYDKLVGFVENLTNLGSRLRQAQKEYEEAYGKLVSGRGNLIGQAEKLKQLGVKPSKALPSTLVDGAMEGPVVPRLLPQESLGVAAEPNSELAEAQG